MQKYKSTNWKDWIFERFGDKTKYEILFNKEHAEYSIRSANKKIKTIIYFSFMNNKDNEVLYDIQFSKNDDKDNYIWASPFTVDKEYKASLFEQLKARTILETSLFYNDKFITRLEEEWLSIPLKYGWTEELYTVGEKVYRAKLKHNGNFNQNINEKVFYYLNDWDKLKLLFGIGKNSNVTRIKSIE